MKINKSKKEKTQPKKKISFGSLLDPLLNALHSEDGEERRRARLSLVSLGSEAVDPLIELLPDPEHEVRWEAAKALGEIADPRSAPALVETLEDAGFDIRWLAAEGLIALGKAGLEPLLEAGSRPVPWSARFPLAAYLVAFSLYTYVATAAVLNMPVPMMWYRFFHGMR